MGLPGSSRRRQWQATPVLLPRKSHGWRSLVGCSPWGRYESDTTKRLHFHFSLSCIGEGNDNPLHVLAWSIPGTGEPGGPPSMGPHRVGHDWSDLAAAAAVADNVEHHFMCLLIICVFSLEKCLLWSFAHFNIGLFIFITEFLEIFVILGTSPLADTWFANICSLSVSCLFIFSMVAFAAPFPFAFKLLYQKYLPFVSISVGRI